MSYLDGCDYEIVMGALRAAPMAVRASPMPVRASTSPSSGVRTAPAAGGSPSSSGGVIVRTAPAAGGSSGGSTGGLGLPPPGPYSPTGRLDLSSGRYATTLSTPPPAASGPTAPAPKISIPDTKPTMPTTTPGTTPPGPALPASSLTPPTVPPTTVPDPMAAATTAAAAPAGMPADMYAPSGGGGGGDPFGDSGSDPFAEYMDASDYGDPYGGELAEAEAAFDYAEAPRRRRKVEEPLEYGEGEGEGGGDTYFEDEYLDPEMLGSYLHGVDIVVGGADIVVGGVDVQGLIQRFGQIAHTNDTARRIWTEHGFPLAQRVTKAAQDLLNKAVVPLNEFTFHDAVVAFAKRADVVGSKISPLPLDDQPCPYWDELEKYVLDGAYLVNALEGTLDGSVKWTDVKESAVSFATGVANAANRIDSTFRWTTGLLVGGSVLLGSAVIYGLYKLLSGPTGQAAAHGLGSAAGRRLMG